MNEKIKKSVYDLASPLVHSMGLAIWGLEVAGNPPVIVRLFVDVPRQENAGNSPEDCASGAAASSASIEQCEEISRQLGLGLEVEDIMPGSWTLEVSTPGLERKFFELAQLKPYVDDLVEVGLRAPIQCGGKRKNLRGRLLHVGSESFDIEPCQIGNDGKIMPEGLPACTISWDNCRIVKRIHVFQAPSKPGKTSRAKK